MSVNNPNQEYRTREEYKQAKAEELQRKKDAEKRAKDESRRNKDAEKHAKDEARTAKQAEKRAKDEPRRTQDAKQPSQNEVQKTQEVAQPTPNVVKEAKPSPKKEAKTADTKGKDKQAGETTPANHQRIRIRLIPIWLRLVLLIVFIVISATIGAIVGYGMLGGGKVSEVFQESTWTHIIDLVEKGK